jgi:WD repeat-containing protein 35
VEKQIPCLYNTDNFTALAKFATDPQHQLQEGSAVLIEIGQRLASVGLVEEAVEAFVRGKDVKAAIDACVLLNQWDMAVELAQEHNFTQIEGLLTKYAQTLLEAGAVLVHNQALI